MGLFKSNDDDDDSFTEQKVWLNPGNSGIAMASSNEKHSTTTTPSPQPQAPTVQPDYSGLQVVESGLEVAGSDQSEALSAGSVPSSQHPFHHHHHHHVNGSAGQGSPFDTTTTTTTSQASPPLRYAEQKGYDWHGAPPPQVVPIEQSGMGGGHRLYSASTGTSQPPPPAQQHQYLGGHNPFDPAAGKPGRKPTICGLKRKLFWGLVAVIIFVIVLAIGVGVGVGLAVKNSSTRYAILLFFLFFFSSLSMVYFDLPWPARRHARSPLALVLLIPVTVLPGPLGGGRHGSSGVT